MHFTKHMVLRSETPGKLKALKEQERGVMYIWVYLLDVNNGERSFEQSRTILEAWICKCMSN